MASAPPRSRRVRGIVVVNRQRAVRLIPRAVRDLASRVLDSEHVGAPLGVNIVVLGPRAMRRYNRDFMGHDWATDVLSFPAQEPLRAAPTDIPTVGDVIVSAACAIEYARAHGRAVDEELGRYIVHGVLHCLGYDDTTNAARAAMTVRQEQVLRQWRAAGGGRVCLIPRKSC